MFLFAVITLYLTINYFFHTNKKIGISIVKGILTFSLLISLSTEYLSFFHYFNKRGLIVFWIINSLILILVHHKTQNNIFSSLIFLRKNAFSIFKKISIFQKGILLLLFILFFSIVTQSILYPPNNWDSMTYHLPRIIHWIQNNSIENYPTNITRQIYSPPFSEYAIAQVSILTNSDKYVNLVQLFYLIGTCFVVVEILKLMTKNRKVLFYSFCLSFSLPEAVLQASSTQNDIVHSFFLLSSLFFLFHFLKNQNYLISIWLGIAIGLALLSKIIAFFYIPALLVVLGIFIIHKIYNTKSLFALKSISISALLIIFINFNFTVRKLDFTHNLSGTSENIEDGITFDKYNIKLLISTCVKNIAIHSDPVFIGNFGNIFAEKTHLLLKQDINEKGSNVFDAKFNAVGSWRFHEDFQPNMLITFLFLICILILVIQLKNRKTRIVSPQTVLFFVISLQFFILNLIIRWEPWNSRIHTPVFFEMIIFCCLTILKETKTKNVIFYFSILFSISYAIFISVYNYTRPLMNVDFSVNTPNSRFKNYFMNQPNVYPEFSEFYQILLTEKKAINIGYISHIDGWEYPITSVIYKNNNLHFDHIRVSNTSSKYKQNKNYTYIYSSFINQDTLHFNNSIYKNVSKNNKHIFYYKK